MPALFGCDVARNQSTWFCTAGGVYRPRKPAATLHPFVSGRCLMPPVFTFDTSWVVSLNLALNNNGRESVLLRGVSKICFL